MQQASENWETSSCHSFCSTNERHFRDVDINGEELDFEADRPETVCLPKKPSRPKEILEEGEALGDASSAEVEEGEIKDSSNVESCDDSHRCRFFEKGSCAFGENCRFLHHSDKGLYSMFGRSRPASRNVSNLHGPPVKSKLPLPAVSPEEDAVDWDRELEIAMLRVGMSRKKVPLYELRLTIPATKALPKSPILESNTSARRVRYRVEEEPRLPGWAASKRKKNRISCETDCPSSPKSSRNNKRRHSNTSRFQPRSTSVGRRFSCKCCRTPSPGRRRASTRRPICCYRRRSISASSSSPSPVSKRRARDVFNSPRRKSRGRSRASSPDRTKIRQYIGAAEASSVQGPGSVSQLTKKRRDSRTRAFSKASKIKCSSDKSIVLTLNSSAKVDKLAASYSPDRHLSDMSISPFSSDSDSENDPDVRFSSIHRPSDMSISPFSDSPSPDRFSAHVWRANEPKIGVGVTNPSKVQEGSDLKKRVKSGVLETNPHIVLPQVPISMSSAPKNRFRSEVEAPKPSAVPPKFVDSVLKKRLESDVVEPKPPANQRKEPKFERSTPKAIFQSDVAKPRPPAVPREVPKSESSAPQKRLNHLLFDLMKFHQKGGSTNVAVNTGASHSLERRVKNVDQKSDTHRGVFLSKKELLLKQLQEVNAAIERKKARVK